MNKLGMVIGLAAVATLAGCKDPDYKRGDASASQSDVQNVDTTPAQPIVIEPEKTPVCQCPPGTRPSTPRMCGAPDCTCMVAAKPVVVADISRPPEPAYTTYVVQSGDYLAKISKKFNVTISSIKRLNPSIKENNVVRIGQKLKLPGKVDVGVQTAPARTVSPIKTGKKTFTPYAGATKEYVVKNGDTLGSIAYGSGINIRQLKNLNGLTTDVIKVGQKLKVPAEKVAKAAKPAASKKAVAAVAAEKKPAAVAAAPVVEAAPAAAAETAAPAPAPVEAEEAAPAPVADAPATTTYVVKEGDDMTGVSIRWGVSAADIRELNNLAEGDPPVPGQVITLPADAQP